MGIYHLIYFVAECDDAGMDSVGSYLIALYPVYPFSPDSPDLRREAVVLIKCHFVSRKLCGMSLLSRFSKYECHFWRIFLFGMPFAMLYFVERKMLRQRNV